MRKGGSASRNAWKQCGWIEIREMVGHEDARRVFRNLIAAGDDDANAGKPVPDAHHPLRCVVEKLHIPGDERPGNTDDCCRNAGDDESGKEDERRDHGALSVRPGSTTSYATAQRLPAP